MFRLTVADVFTIRGRGTVATGRIETGSVRVGDELVLDGGRAVTVKGVETFRKIVDEAHAGDDVGLLLEDIGKDELVAGRVLTGPGGGVNGGGVSVPGLGLT